MTKAKAASAASSVLETIPNELARAAYKFSQRFLRLAELDADAQLNEHAAVFADRTFPGVAYDLPRIVDGSWACPDGISFYGKGDEAFDIRYERKLAEGLNRLFDHANIVNQARTLARQEGAELKLFTINRNPSVGVSLYVVDTTLKAAPALAQTISRIERILLKLQE